MHREVTPNRPNRLVQIQQAVVVIGRALFRVLGQHGTDLPGRLAQGCQPLGPLLQQLDHLRLDAQRLGQIDLLGLAQGFELAGDIRQHLVSRFQLAGGVHCR